MRIFRIFFTISMAVLITYMVISRVPYRRPLPSIDAFSPAPKAWQEIGRKPLVEQSWEMIGQTGWWVEGMDGDPNGVRLFLEGSFAASNPGVRMIVMDRDNWHKWQQGYPPLDATSAEPGRAFHLPASTAGYYFGFFPQKPAAPMNSASLSGIVASSLLQAYQQSHPAPIRMSAKVILVVESYSTPAQAAIERRQFAGITK
jgi:hypothetical protein